MTAADVATALSVSRTTAYKLMREIGCVRVGRVVRVSREAFEAWVAAHTRATHPRAASRPREPRDVGQLTLGWKTK